MWRMTDGQKRKVWFEWSASAYLSASSLVFSATPPGSATSGTFPGNRGQSSADNLSPSPWDARRGPNAGTFSPHPDAFASAISPRVGQDWRDSGRMPGGEEEGEGPQRILVAYSKLVNPGGRTSWLGL